MNRVADPQQINIYIYARNNPLLFVDPVGLDIQVSGDAQDDYLKHLQGGVKSKNFVITKDANGKLGVQGLDLSDKKAVDKFKKGLKDKGDIALFTAITTGNTAKIEANKVNDKVSIAQFIGVDGTQRLDMGEISLFDSSSNKGGMTTSDVVAHETLEAWYGVNGKPSYNDAHNAASEVFGGLSDAILSGQFNGILLANLNPRAYPFAIYINAPASGSSTTNSGYLVFDYNKPGNKNSGLVTKVNVQFASPISQQSIVAGSQIVIKNVTSIETQKKQ